MTVLAALATAVRERLAAGHDAPLPGFGTLRRQHIPARVQERPDGGRVLLPPSETVRFSQDATDPSAVAAALARTQDLPAAAGATALSDAVDQLEAIVVATGEARLPGVGLFRRTSSSVLFAADTMLLTEINRPYAGLGPVEAAPAPPAVSAPPEPSAPEPTAPEPVVPVYAPPTPPEGSVDALRGGLEASAPTAPSDAEAEHATTVEPAEDIVAFADDAASDPGTPADSDASGATDDAPADDATDDALDTDASADDASPPPAPEAFGLGTLPPVAHDPFGETPLPAPAAEHVETVEAAQAEDAQDEAEEPEDSDAPSRDAPTDITPSSKLSTHVAEPVDTQGDEKPDSSPLISDEAADRVMPIPAPSAAPETGAWTETETETEADAMPATASPDVSAEGAPTPPTPRRRRRRTSDTGAVDLFLESVLPLGARNSRRRTPRAADVSSEETMSGDESWVQPTVGKPGVEHATPEEVAPTQTDPEPLPAEPATPSTASFADSEDAAPLHDDAPHDGSPLAAVAAALGVAAVTPDWGADPSTPLPETPLPDVDLSLGEDLDEDDFADIEPADLVAPTVADAPTASRSVLDDIYATDRDQPLSDSDAFIGSDLGAASASATALGMGMDAPARTERPYGRRATDRVPAPLDAEPPSATPPVPIPPPAPVADDRWFSFGSLLLLAVSLAAIAAAASWPSFAGTPATPAPTPGSGAFGDTLGDAAEAAVRERQALRAAGDSTATPAAPSRQAATPPASPDAAASDAGSASESAEATPDAVSAAPPTAPAERRTLGVAPPSGTAILPPRVAGLPGGQTRALASADGLARGAGFTWVVLSSPGRDEANTLAQRYRQSGYRAGVVATTAAGRTTYRVGVGQYGSRGDARTLRSRLPPQAPDDTWLLDLSSSGLSF